MSLSPNTTLAHYTIISKIGAGGMGEVYRARDTRLGRDVAIKLLPAEVSTDVERLKRFEQEARAASALNHSNILTVYDIGTNSGSPYLVAELLEGETAGATGRRTTSVTQGYPVRTANRLWTLRCTLERNRAP